MSATTIKLEDRLLRDIRVIKPPTQSVSAWVRETLEHEIQQRRMAEAARNYQIFLKEQPDEAASLKEWEAASLDRIPRTRRR